MKKLTTILLLSICMLLQANGSTVSAAYQLKYDLNNDGVNDITDLTYFSLYLIGETEPSNITKYDFDNNKIISYRDYTELRNFITYSH